MFSFFLHPSIHPSSLSLLFRPDMDSKYLSANKMNTHRHTHTTHTHAPISANPMEREKIKENINIRNAQNKPKQDKTNQNKAASRKDQLLALCLPACSPPLPPLPLLSAPLTAPYISYSLARLLHRPTTHQNTLSVCMNEWSCVNQVYSVCETNNNNSTTPTPAPSSASPCS